MTEKKNPLILGNGIVWQNYGFSKLPELLRERQPKKNNNNKNKKINWIYRNNPKQARFEERKQEYRLQLKLKFYMRTLQVRSSLFFCFSNFMMTALPPDSC